MKPSTEESLTYIFTGCVFIAALATIVATIMANTAAYAEIAAYS